MVEEVKRTVPVVSDLRSGTLMSRHWDLLDDVLGVDIRKGESLTFKQMMEVRASSQQYIFASHEGRMVSTPRVARVYFVRVFALSARRIGTPCGSVSTSTASYGHCRQTLKMWRTK